MVDKRRPDWASEDSTREDYTGDHVEDDVLRSVLLTDSVRRGGTSRRDPVDHVVAAVLSRDDDQKAAAVVEQLAEQQSAVPVAWWGLGAFLDIATKHDELADWADSVRARYLPEPENDAHRQLTR